MLQGMYIWFNGHIRKHSQRLLTLADTVAISSQSLVVCVPFQKKRIIYIMCVFPKRCEQPVLCAGFLLANVLNWPWETVHPQMLGRYVRNGSLFCLCVCCYTHAGLRAHMRQAFLCASPCVCSWWLCARQTAFICININTCLSCSPSHSCPLVQSVQGWPLSSCSGCRWTWSKGRWARWRGQTVRLSICCVEKIKVCGRHTSV